jgi:hypothetical protein
MGLFRAKSLPDFLLLNNFDGRLQFFVQDAVRISSLK